MMVVARHTRCPRHIWSGTVSLSRYLPPAPCHHQADPLSLHLHLPSSHSHCCTASTGGFSHIFFSFQSANQIRRIFAIFTIFCVSYLKGSQRHLILCITIPQYTLETHIYNLDPHVHWHCQTVMSRLSRLMLSAVISMPGQ